MCNTLYLRLVISILRRYSSSYHCLFAAINVTTMLHDKPSIYYLPVTLTNPGNPPNKQTHTHTHTQALDRSIMCFIHGEIFYACECVKCKPVDKCDNPTKSLHRTTCGDAMRIETKCDDRSCTWTPYDTKWLCHLCYFINAPDKVWCKKILYENGNAAWRGHRRCASCLTGKKD